MRTAWIILLLICAGVGYGFESYYKVMATDTLAEANYICTPSVRTYLGYNRRVVQLLDGQTYAFFSLGTKNSNWLFLLNTNNLTIERYNMPNGDIGSHSNALCTDGNIYIMPYETGRAYCFDVRSRKFKDLQVDLPAGEYTWDAIGGDNGRIYFGTYPNGCFGEYDPVTGKTKLLKNVRNTKYVMTFFKDSNDSVGCHAIGPGTRKLRYNFKNERLEDVNEAALSSHGGPVLGDAQKQEPVKAPDGDVLYFGQKYVAQLTYQGRNFALSFPSSRLWEIEPNGQCKLLGQVKAPGEPWYLAGARGGIVGVSYFGVVFRFDFAMHKIVQKQLDNLSAGGSELMFVESVGGGSIIGAHGSQQNLFKLDVLTGKIEYAPTMVARTVGEPMCAITYKNRAYLGIYTKAILSSYDPASPFQFGNNPREIAAFEEHKQTRPRDFATDGKFIYMSIDSDYNCLGGAFVVIDPVNDKVQAFPQLIKEQNLPSLAYDEASGLIWGGTDRWGQMRSVPPTQPSSVVYAFDPQKRSVAHKLTVWDGSDETVVLGTSGKGHVVLANPSNNEIAVVNTQTCEIAYKGHSPFQNSLPSRIKRGSDNRSYCINSGMMYHWDFQNKTITSLAKVKDAKYFTEVVPGIWAVADGISIFSVSLGRTK